MEGNFFGQIYYVSLLVSILTIGERVEKFIVKLFTIY